MFGALKSSWSEWAPVLQQLPAAAVEGVKSAAGRNKSSSNSSHSSGGGGGAEAGSSVPAGSSVSAARLAAIRSAAHDAPSASAASPPPSSAASASDSTAASGGGARLFGFTSKLASNLKEGWRAKVGGGAGAAAGSSARAGAEEERGFLIDPSRSGGGGSSGLGLGASASAAVAVETKLSKNGVDAFSFDDHDPPEEEDAEHAPPRTPLGLNAADAVESSARPSPLAQHKQNRAAASAAAASAAAYSSAAQAASASSKSAAAAAAARASQADADSAVAPASHFASLPKLSASFAVSSSSSAAAAPPFSFDDPSSAARSGGKGSGSGARSDRDAVRAGAYVESQMFASRDLERQQDELLDDMSHSIGRLQQMGTEINTQLSVGNAMLNELDDEMSQAQDTFSVLDRKMSKLLKRSSLPHLKIIFCLLLLIAFLLFLLFYW